MSLPFASSEWPPPTTKRDGKQSSVSHGVCVRSWPEAKFVFLKNVAMAVGFVLLVQHGSGVYSLDNRAGR